MPGSILGTRVVRTEDPELLVGGAKYVSDLPLDNPLFLVFVRSEMAHALITSIDTSSAEEMPGVVAVWTAAELDVAPHHGMVKVHDDFARAPLAIDRVRFVGDAIVAVFAESPTEARDAADAVIVDYEPLDALVAPEDALADGAGADLRAPRQQRGHLLDRPGATRRSSPTPTSSCAAATSTSASPSPRWSRTPRPPRWPTTGG